MPLMRQGATGNVDTIFVSTDFISSRAAQSQQHEETKYLLD